ncbi:MAG: PAS domain-containing protein [Chromatiales bacterium]|nr:PAS domain-containing protein [Chromatiales bacterium]
MVAIGASAGGLTALEQFFGQVPPDSGLAYVVVQHLDPTQKALLPELLQRITGVPVHEARQHMRIEPDCVYVIPPNTELSVINGTLRLTEPAEPRGRRLPVDILFSSLASARGDQAIAVILSGMGADGTLGLQAIKAVGGLVVVQDPATAQFDSMPASAIATGCADIIGPAEALPARILDCIHKARQPDRGAREAEPPAAPSGPLQQVLQLLQQQTRHDFSLYKRSTLHRRIERRMAIHRLPDLARYAAFLQQNPQEVTLLFNELLIGVTSFFRDPPVWDYLAEVALPALLERRGKATALRAWVVGCSTGEEAYSLAIAFCEALERLPQPDPVTLQVFASDLSTDAIARARRGQYPASISESMPPARLARFFTECESGYRVIEDIRQMVLFARHDVVLDPPFTRLDLVTCRNLLIYFDRRLQQRLLPLFHYSLRPGGLLLLGSSETIGPFTQLFMPLQPKLRIFARQDQMVPGGPDMLVRSFPPLTPLSKEPAVPRSHVDAESYGKNLKATADRILLQEFAPAAVLLNRDADIVYISGHTGKYLEPAAGHANWNFHAMVRDTLRGPIAAALRRAAEQAEPVQLHGLELAAQGGSGRIDVTVQVLREPAALKGMTMVVFRDLPPAPTGRRPRRTRTAVDAAHAEEIQRYREEIQALSDEARETREELQSANEEMQSTNEELQSTNEELTTSKEEMQSMNEELQTINAELQTRLDDLALAQSDMHNLLNSIEIAILFLDQDLNVRRYTDRAAKIINLRESDVGRPLSDLTSSLEYPELHEDALETLRTLKFTEKQILATDGRWFSVRIMPYRRLDNVIDGVVITLVDITETKKLESALRRDAKS